MTFAGICTCERLLLFISHSTRPIKPVNDMTFICLFVAFQDLVLSLVRDKILFAFGMDYYIAMKQSDSRLLSFIPHSAGTHEASE